MALKKIKGTEGKDLLEGGNARELIIALGGNDRLFGNGGADELQGGDGNDLLDGGTGADVMKGGDGNDTYVVDDAHDAIKELAGEGTDVVISSVSFTLSNNVEKLKLSGNANINATGNVLANLLIGNAGDNILDGAGGADKMIGGKGDDTFVVDDAGDQASEKSGEGSDLVQSSIGLVLAGNIENLTLTGATDIDGTGNDLRNVITGNSGSNVLDGGTNIDWMLGGAGNDTYIVDNSADKITELVDGGTDSVLASASYNLSANIENLTLTGALAINGKGNDRANIIIGNGAANKLYADNTVGDSVGGGDELHGGNGADTLYSGDGSNALFGDAGIDIADYSLFSTVVTVNVDGFLASVDKTAGGSDTLTEIEGVRGGTGDDIFNVSYAGTFYGGAGSDMMSDSQDGDATFATLYGDGGDDILSAGIDGGNLMGGADNDLLSAFGTGTVKISMDGGSGADRFQLAVNIDGQGGILPDGTLSAPVTVESFVNGVDVLAFQAFGSTNTAQEWYDLLFAQNTIEDETDGLHIGADGGTGEALIKDLFLANFTVDDIVVLF